MPTQNGAAVIDPAQVSINPNPPPVIIESCLVDRKPFPALEHVRLQPTVSSFDIQYTALSFADPERIHFKYKLEGLEQDWIDAGSRRTAYYSNVPRGSYNFRVIAANPDGVWNSSGQSLTIIVLPHFYETWWFLALAVTAGAAMVFLAVHLRASQLERARARVAQQVFLRQLIASQEKERKRIAAELHDSLGQRLVIVKNLALLLLQTRDGASGLSGRQRERVEEISAEASGAVHEVKEISYNLRPYRLDRLGLTAALKGETAAAASTITFSAEIEDIDGVLPKEDEINFYRIVQECVNNVLKHSQAGLATILVQRTKGRLTLIVRDDGNGFAPGSAGASTLGGFGLTGISERAQLMGGKAAVQSAPAQGTTVTIEIGLAS